ncbi:MAG TPA: hypothetical protein GX503_06205 [Clostridiales bacterium]|nr:hypothetical protein [Clostridiales bacterium]
MKKISMLLIMGLMFFLVACGGEGDGSIMNNGDSSSVYEQEDNNETEKDEIKVDKDLFSVEITIPAILIAGDDPEQIKAEAEKEEGIHKVTINKDGSLTYSMSKAAHKRMIDEMKKSLEETIEEIKSSGDYPSIMDIKADKSYAEFTMIVDRESYENSFDGFAAFGLGVGSMFYQIFDGADAEAAKATIYVEDSNTGEIFNTIVYPDDLY